MTDPEFVRRELRAAPGIRALPWGQRVENRMRSLRSAPRRAPIWWETEGLFRNLSLGKSDHLGRRIFSDAARADARLVARHSHRAYHGAELTPREWSYLEASVRRVYQELEQFGGRGPATGRSG